VGSSYYTDAEKTDRVRRTPLQKLWYPRATIWDAAARRVFEGKALPKPAAVPGSGYTKLWKTPKSSINRAESGAGAPRSKTFCIGTYASAGFNFPPHSYRVDLNCLKSTLLPASCRQLKLVSGRLGQVSITFSVARTLVQRE